jgi:MIP family channel proteins
MPNAAQPLIWRTLGEAGGTFGLVLIGAGSVVIDARTGGGLGSLGIALAFGTAVAAAVYALRPFSGAHINPAVTVAFWSRGHFPGREVGPYVIAQCTGALGAAVCLKALFGRTGLVGATVPEVPAVEALCLEALLSFILMLVIASFASGDTSGRIGPAIAVGLAVGVNASFGGPLTGASMNPARSFGPGVASGTWTYAWIYWIGPVSGMVAAIWFWCASWSFAGAGPGCCGGDSTVAEGPKGRA